MQQNFKKLIKRESFDAFLYLATTSITQLGSFILLPFYWKVLTPADYGIIAVIDIIGVFLAVPMGLCLDQALTRFYYTWEESERKKELGAIWLTSWISCLVFSLIATLGIMWLRQFFLKEINPQFLLLGMINIGLNSLAIIPLATIRIKKKAGLYTINRISMFIIQCVLGLLLVYKFRYGIAGFYYSLVISAFISVVFLGVCMGYFATPAFYTKKLFTYLKYSFPIIPSYIMNSMTGMLDRLILKSFGSLEMLGLYSLAQRFAGVINIFQAAIKLAYQPFFMKNATTENGKILINKIMFVYIAPIFIVAILLLYFVDDVVFWINSVKYFEIVSYIPMLIAAAVIQSLVIFFANGIPLSNKTHLMLIPAIIQLGVQSSGFVMIKWFGMDGLIFSRLLAVAAFFISSVLISNRVYMLNNDWRSLFIFGVIASIPCIGFSFINNADITSWKSNLFGNVAGCLAVLGLLIGYCVYTFKKNGNTGGLPQHTV